MRRRSRAGLRPRRNGCRVADARIGVTSGPARPGAFSAAVSFWLAIAAVAATFGQITLGSFVRVSGAGLACPDWPLCHGQLIPPLDYYVLIEYSHRLFGSLVILLVGALFVQTMLATLLRRGDAQRVFLPASVAFGFLIFVAVLGGITVLAHLPPLIVTLHLATAETVFAALIVSAVAARGFSLETRVAAQPALPAPSRLMGWSLVVLLATMLSILSGAYVVAEGATLACGGGLGGWPLCDGSLIPTTERQAVQLAHRLVVIGALAASVMLVRTAWMERDRSKVLGRVALVLAHLLVLQILVGALIPWMQFEQFPRVLHIALATGVWGCAVLAMALAGRWTALQASAEPDAGRTGRGTANAGTASFSKDLVTLTKPRVMVLLLVTATGGMVLAAGGIPPLGVAAAVLVGGALASGGAGSINHGIEGGIDRTMVRTRQRPVASGRVSPQFAIGFGIALNAVSFVLLSSVANVLAASLAVGGSVFYVFVYTMWLKRTTVQNIVIGGAAGAVPPLVGWAAVTGGLDLPALYLFAIVFFWTPPHFWALSLLIQDDYARARVPMLPVVRGEIATQWSIFLYVLLVNVLAVMFFLSTNRLGLLYLASVLVLGGLFGYYAWRLLMEKHRAATLRLYKYSILYLALVFLVVMVDGSI